ncbi:MAG: hypothetical protein ABJC13_18630 [Acidobacteriota bacterium]
MLTVKVIVFGLIAIVPHFDTHTVTLLFVDSLKIPGKDNPAHIPFIGTWGGVNCSGDCGFPLKDGDLDASSDIGKKTVELLNKGTIDWPKDLPSDLNWIPVGRVTRMLNLESQPRVAQLLGNDFAPKALPEVQQQVASWRWILSMQTLTSGKGQIDGKCIRAPEKCPISASLEIPFDKLGSCHLLSLGDDKVVSYTIKKGSGTFEQAISDGALLEFSVPGNSFEIETGCLDSHKCYHKKATLTPSNKLQGFFLLVGNMPYPKSDGHLHYFASLESTSPPNPVAVPEITKNTQKLDVFSEECQVWEDSVRSVDGPRPSFLDFVAFENKPECGPVIFRN